MLLHIAIGITLFTIIYAILEVPLQTREEIVVPLKINSPQDIINYVEQWPIICVRPIVDLLVNQVPTIRNNSILNFIFAGRMSHKIKGMAHSSLF
jgi:hypothetical protein